MGGSGELAGRTVALVGVGASGEVSSNGRAAALAFARAGAALVLMDNSAAGLRDCADAVADAGAKHLVVELDATSESDVRAGVQAALETFGHIDVLHNNIGITQYGHLPAISLAEWERIFTVNLTSQFLLCREIAPLMRERGTGVITTVSSISSVRHLGIASPAYDASKAAVNALCRYLAVAYGPFGVRANSLLLGMMDTPLARDGIAAGRRPREEVYDEYTARIPLGRLGHGGDCGEAAVFLASDRSAYLNGAEIVLDGGLTLTTR